MEEFLIKNYIQITYSFELVAVVIGLISYKKYKGTPAAFFIKIVCFLFFIEIIGSYAFYYDKFEFLKPLYNSVFRQNYWWFTLFFDIGVTLLFSALFIKILKKKKHQNILKYLNYAYIIFTSIYLICNRDVFFFQTFPLIQIAGALIIVTCTFIYFLNYFRVSYY